jgi:hypothetical protein
MTHKQIATLLGLKKIHLTQFEGKLYRLLNVFSILFCLSKKELGRKSSEVPGGTGGRYNILINKWKIIIKQTNPTVASYFIVSNFQRVCKP